MSTTIARPGMPLTKREWQVVQLAARGMNTKEVARELHIDPRTVEDHRMNAYVKYGVHNFVGLLHKLSEAGMPCLCCGRTAE